MNCRLCGKAITQTGTGRPRQYCNWKCTARVSHWRRKTGRSLEDLLTHLRTRRCGYCSLPIAAHKNVNAKFCCDRCLRRHHASRVRIGS